MGCPVRPVPGLLAPDLELIGILQCAVDGERPLSHNDVFAHVVCASRGDVTILVAGYALVEAEIAVGIKEGKFGAREVLSRISGSPGRAL